MLKKPICDNPITGSMETMSGYRLCCNPAHDKERYGILGPVWHLISEWPPNVPKEQLQLEAFESWWSTNQDEYEDNAYGAAKAAWFART